MIAWGGQKFLLRFLTIGSNLSVLLANCKSQGNSAIKEVLLVAILGAV
jgi:hypothetical protein